MLRKVKTKKNEVFSSKEMSHILAGGDCPADCGCGNCGLSDRSAANLSNNSSSAYSVTPHPIG